MTTLYNLARMYTSTTGDSDITLTTAVPGCKTFAAAGVSDSEDIHYGLITFDLITHRPTASEVGTGRYIASGTLLKRTPINSTDSDDGAINLTGLSEVFITALSSDFTLAPGSGVDSAKYSGGVNTVTVNNSASGTLTIDTEEWDTATLGSVDSDTDTVTFGVDGTYEIGIEVFWDIPTAGAPNGVLGVRATTSQGNHEHWEHFETADDMSSNSIFMSWKIPYTSGDTISLTAYNYMGRTIRFNVREVSLMKLA